ncbi:MAG: Fe-S cluster assembly protein SufD [Anaerolinea sp.]|nr:Fe-S cluster assembly protein SufD [Anaerolinea sp.]
MANETPVVISRTRRTTAAGGQQSFAFEEGQVRTAGLSAGIGEYRRRAWQVYKELPMPTTQMEAWRRTDLRGLQAGSLRLAQPQTSAVGPEIPAALLQPMADDEHAGQLLLQPHRVDVTLLPKLVRQGVVFTDLRTAEERYPHLLEQALGRVVRPEEGKFSALAGALAQTGVLLYVPRGVQVTQPLHSILWTPGVGLAHVSHVILWLEEGASATYIHEMSSPTEDGQTMHAGLVEVYVGAGANLRFVEMQSFGEHVWNVTHERVHVERDGAVDWVFGAMGGRLTKNFSELDLVGPGAVGKMSGFYFTDGEQHLDYDSQQNHLAPHTTSDLLFKGALVGKSRSVWQGMIYVAPGAVKTDGYQANRNLVLSREARADSIPGLEILADDVRCTHGATVGKVDAEQVFYLQARGIPELEARRLVVEGFFDPIMQRIPFEGVRARFQDAIHQKMQAYTG